MTTAQPIPDDVRRFVMTSVPSVPYLEAMLLFHSASELERNRAEVASLLYLNEQVAGGLLEALCSAGVIVPAGRGDGRFRYAPGEAAQAAIDRLALAYAGNLVGVTNLIHDRTQRSAQRFADAFKLREDR
jgi:hypothetical protein